jgi:O-antigen/teichoic acid export membrane protein
MSAFRPVLANAAWNLFGTLLPLTAGLVAVPFLVQRLGVERFGLLSLGWVLIGYFGLFDLGLGRAMTKMVAERTFGRSESELESLCSTGLALGAVTGLLGGMLVAAAACLGDFWFSNWSPALLDEARRSLLLISVGVLPAVGAAVLRGILEGFQRFKALNVIRVPAGVLLFVAPCLSAWFTPRLDVAVAALVLTRWLVLIAHVLVCRESVRMAVTAVRVRWIKPLLRFGSWLTVSNIIGPMIVYLDRFVIGALLPPSQLAYYSAPFEMVSRLLVLPMSLTSALFPALANAQKRDAQHALSLRRNSVRLTLALVIPATVIGVVVARPLLQLWLGEEFAAHGSLPMQILLVGFAFNALAQIPMVALYGHGLARQAAILHMVELPIYGVFLFMMVRDQGLVGAAFAWAARGVVDVLVLNLLLRRAEQSIGHSLSAARG